MLRQAATGAAPAAAARARLPLIGRALSRGEEERRTPPVAIALSLILVATLGFLIVEAAGGKSPLLPPSPSMTKWLEGLAGPLGFRAFLICLLVFTAAYAGVLAYSRRISRRLAIALVAALNIIVFIGPVLISTDVFSYIAYARMAVMHGVNPYLHGPAAIESDPIFKYVGTDWLKATTAYGPLYTLISYPIAPLGLIASVWGMKVEALIGAGVTLWLTWRCAVRRGFDPVPALIVVGANPLWVIYGMGGSHNDIVMLAFMMGAVALTLSQRDFSAGTTIVAGAFVKATAIALLPFMVLARRSKRQILGAIAGVVVFAGIGYALFGINGADIFSILTKDSSYVSSDGFPTEFMHLIGKPGVFPVDHMLLKIALGVVVLYLMWRTWRGYDWVAASGFALLAIAVTSPWMLAWYTLWGLPLSVISKDRRLLISVLVVQLLFILHQTAPLFSPIIE